MTATNRLRPNHILRPEITIRTTIIIPEKVNPQELQAEITIKTTIIPEKIKRQELQAETIIKVREAIQIQTPEAMLQDRKTMRKELKLQEKIVLTEG